MSKKTNRLRARLGHALQFGEKKLRAVDLCAGAGGWAVASRGLPIEMVCAVDLWEAAAKTYQLNHPDTRVIVGDLRDAAVRAQVMEVTGGHVDLVVGGIPCEWLSVYRVLQPAQAVEIARERETLDVVLQLKTDLKPRFWCLEDVKQLAKELPLMTPWVELNSRDFSAQRRKRIYVGDFPPPPKQRCADTLVAGLRPGPYRIGRRAFGRTPQRARTFSRETALGAWPDLKAPTVCANDSRRDAELVVVDERMPGGIRQMEWQEAAQLQGFPNDYLFYGSPTDVFTQIGRAIQIDTGRAILKSIVGVASKLRGGA